MLDSFAGMHPHGSFKDTATGGFAMTRLRKRTVAAVVFVVLAMALFPAPALAAGQLGSSVANLAEQAAYDEIEPNGDFDSATTIDMNTTVYGIADGGEADCFQVDVPQSGAVKLTFVNEKYDNKGYFDISLYNRYYERAYTSTNTSNAWLYTRSTRPYAITYNLKQGVNRIVIKGTSGQPYHFKLTFIIPPTTVKASAVKKFVTAKWTKKSGASSYQLRCSTNKNMHDAKVFAVSGKVSSRKITGLVNGQKYWLQVRVAKEIGGQVYYSSWSAKKSITTSR